MHRRVCEQANHLQRLRPVQPLGRAGGEQGGLRALLPPRTRLVRHVNHDGVVEHVQQRQRLALGDAQEGVQQLVELGGGKGSVSRVPGSEAGRHAARAFDR